MIEIVDLTFRYGSQEPIFDGFSWSVAAGDSWAILGPSGCGKTTLLYLLAGLKHPTAGSVCVGTGCLGKPRPGTGLILQDYGLLPWATVYDNVALGLRLRSFYGPDGRHAPRETANPPDDRQAQFWVDRLGLRAVADQYPGQLSGGQRQRTAIARTLTLNPDLLLMDEPFASLDAPTRESLQRLILQLQEERGLTVVIVTHAIEEAVWMGRKILVLSRATNRMAEIIENPNAGQPGYQNSSAYASLCDRLRIMLGEVERQP